MKFKQSLSNLIAQTGTGHLGKPQEMLIPEVVAELKAQGIEVNVEENLNGKKGFTFTVIKGEK